MPAFFVRKIVGFGLWFLGDYMHTGKNLKMAGGRLAENIDISLCFKAVKHFAVA